MAKIAQIRTGCGRRLAAFAVVLVPSLASAQAPTDAASVKAKILSTPAAQVVSPGSAPVPSAGATAKSLKAGDTRIKQLPADLEAASAALIRERLTAKPPNRGIGETGRPPGTPPGNAPGPAGKDVPQTDPGTIAQAAQVVVFKGAAEMLAHGSSSLLTLKALAIVNSPLRYDVARRMFSGTVSLGVVEIEPSGSVQTLSAPIDFEVLGLAADPRQVQAKTTSPPFATVRVDVRDPDGDSVDVRVRSILSPDREEAVALKVDRPILKVSVSPDVIQGWGLETASLLVSADEARGSRETLQAASRLGRLSQQRIALDQEGLGSATLRSASIGRDTVTVGGSPFKETTVAVTFAPPVRFIIAATVGGLVGGVLRIGRRIRVDAQTARDLALSVLTGAVVFGLYALGVNVTGFDLPAQAGEVVVFVVAAIGAFVGTRLLSPVAGGAKKGK